MNRLSLLLDRRDKTIYQLSLFPHALAGNLSQSQVPLRTGKYYWRLTWKEKQKTCIQYIRQEELDLIQEGVRQFANLRKSLLQLGELNRAIMLLQRDEQ